MTTNKPTRAERRAGRVEERRNQRRRGRNHGAAERRREQVGRLAFGGVVVAVLAVGAYLAFSDFIGRPGGTETGAISVQASMAGFTPSEIRVKAGEPVVLDFWTQDSSGHLVDGVHTMISDELGLYATLPGADVVGTSRVAVEFMAPSTPGVYDIYCDTCCGGRDSPTMHGRIVVEAAEA